MTAPAQGKEKQKRATRTLTVGRAFDALTSLHAERHVAADAAVRKVHERFAEREAKIYAGLGEGDATRVRSMLDVAEATRESAPFLAEVGDAFGHTLGHATIDDPDDVPAKPALEEYPKGASDYVPGPAAQAARGKR